jgi:hypothetical protein
MIDHKVLTRKQLIHIKLNKETGFYESEKLHLTLLNSTFAMKTLLHEFNKRTFDSTPVFENHPFESIDFPQQAEAKTIELSTRFKYDEVSGFYVSQYTIDL